MKLKEGTLLHGGNYQIVRHVSSGGFGNTYEGLDVVLNRRVAIKEFFVKDFCLRDADSTHVTVSVPSKKPLIEHLRKKFVDEARAIANMEHDNIVKVLTLFEENGTAYYVMDYIDGESVGDLLKRRGPLPESEALPIILKVASALGYMHQQNRFHLDVKPGNIMLRRDGKVVLIDFGSSKQYAEVDGENTTTMAPCYTPGYAPSEQMNPRATKFTAATDLYALGATLYKMLTGVTPPSAIDLQNEDEVLPPLPAEISPSVRACVEKAMIPQRSKRTQSVAEFVALLRDEERTVVDPDAQQRAEEERRRKEAAAQAAREKEQRELVSRSFSVNGVSFEMIQVKAGTFTMGATDEQQNPKEWEKPAHQVTLTEDYYIGQTQVTQALWQAVMGSNPSHFKGDNLPVENVSWDDCQTFITRLNAATGEHFRLPTEAEWEFAARGGNNSDHTRYSGSSDQDAVAWYYDNSGKQTHPVASKQTNELGIYDMSGNVLEWCQDWYDYYSSGSQTNPEGPSSGSYHVSRGGSWFSNAGGCRVSDRNFFTPSDSFSDLGLRLALYVAMDARVKAAKADAERKTREDANCKQKAAAQKSSKADAEHKAREEANRKQKAAAQKSSNWERLRPIGIVAALATVASIAVCVYFTCFWEEPVAYDNEKEANQELVYEAEGQDLEQPVEQFDEKIEEQLEEQLEVNGEELEELFEVLDPGTKNIVICDKHGNKITFDRHGGRTTLGTGITVNQHNEGTEVLFDGKPAVLIDKDRKCHPSSEDITINGHSPKRVKGNMTRKAHPADSEPKL